MRKRIWTVIATVVLMAAVALPTAAEGGKVRMRWDGEIFALVGEVVAADVSGSTITVLVQTWNGEGEDLSGQTIDVSVTRDTQFLEYVYPGCVMISFGDIQSGDLVGISGRVVTDGYVAERVTVNPALDR